jgi:hypothetical protein
VHKHYGNKDKHRDIFILFYFQLLYETFVQHLKSFLNIHM